MEDSLDDMQLPSVNPKDELEELSSQRFQPLFEVSRFQIRAEQYRDRGIDLTIELKKNTRHTNFRFSVQLKATDSIEPNSDGSYSLSINTSNLNYLLNGVCEAYYVLYVKPKDVFLVKSVNELLAALNSKDEDWRIQKTHTIRFAEELSQSRIENIYQSVLSRGKAMRLVNENFSNQSQALKDENSIIIDSNYSVTTDLEVRNLIEKGGFYLVNEGRWLEVIKVHKKATGSLEKSPKYNMVLGMAHFYNGDYYESISFLTKALKKRDELDSSLVDYLIYFETQVKHGLGIICAEEWNAKMNSLDRSSSVGLYVKLQEAKEEYINTLGSIGEQRIQSFRKKIDEIISNAGSDENIKLIARAELSLFEGYDANMIYVRNTAMLNAVEQDMGFSIQMRVDAVDEFTRRNTRWYKDIKEIQKDAAEQKNYFAYFLAVQNEILVWHEMEVYVSVVRPTVNRENDMPPFELDREMMQRQLERLRQAKKFYRQIGHKMNICSVLSIEFEIQRFYEMQEESSITLKHLETVILENDLLDQKEKLEHLKNGGTTFEVFSRFVDEKLKKEGNTRIEVERINEELQALDNAESQKKPGGHLDKTIHLFPLGCFRVSYREKEKVFDILGISSSSLQKRISDMWNDRVIPVVNIYKYPIEVEGFGNGVYDNQGLPSLKNIYRIRKEFFAAGFLKDHITPAGERL